MLRVLLRIRECWQKQYLCNRYKCSRRCRKDCISNSNHYGYESITDVSIDYLLGLEKNMNLDVTGLDTEQIRIFTDLAEHFRKEKKAR